MWLARGIQKLRNGVPYDAISFYGRAQQKLAKHEYRAELIAALVGCGMAYESAGQQTPDLARAAESVYTEYLDPPRDEWQTKILPALKKLPVSLLQRLSHRSRSMVYRAQAGRSRPRIKNQKLLASILRRMEIA